MKVKLRRIEKGIKQQDMAAKLGISKATLVKIEKGELDIRLSLMKKIAKMLDCKPQELFF